jgi:hypothetical protein
MLQRATEGPPNVTAATEFFQALFGTTVGPTNVCTLSNDGARAGSHLTSSNHEALGRFAEAKDQRGHGVYFCVSTLKNEKLIHSKPNISEIPSLHADIDFKDLGILPGLRRPELTSFAGSRCCPCLHHGSSSAGTDCIVIGFLKSLYCLTTLVRTVKPLSAGSRPRSGCSPISSVVI